MICDWWISISLCTDPPPLRKNLRRDPFSDFSWGEGRGGSVHRLDFDPFCVFTCFIVRFWTLEFTCFDRERHIRNPRGRLGTRLRAFVKSAANSILVPRARYKLSRVALGTRMSKLPQKFCYHGNVATHFFFLKSAVNPPHPPQERSCFPQICTCRSPKIFPDPKLSNLSPPCFFNFADFFFIPRASRSTCQLLPTWIRSVLALLFRARRTECSFNCMLHWHGWLSGKLCKCCRWGFPMLYL